MIRCCCSRCLGAVLFIDADVYLEAHENEGVAPTIAETVYGIPGEVLLSQRRHPSSRPAAP